jgi:hypothetical protein
MVFDSRISFILDRYRNFVADAGEDNEVERKYSKFIESKVSRHQFIKILGATGILVSLATFTGIIKTPRISALSSQATTIPLPGTKDFTAIKTPIDSHFVAFIQKVDKDYTAIKLTLTADFTALKNSISKDFTASKLDKVKDFVTLRQTIDSDITAYKQKIDTIFTNFVQNINSDITAMKLGTSQYFSATKSKVPTNK